MKRYLILNKNRILFCYFELEGICQCEILNIKLKPNHIKLFFNVLDRRKLSNHLLNIYGFGREISDARRFGATFCTISLSI